MNNIIKLTFISIIFMIIISSCTEKPTDSKSNAYYEPTSLSGTTPIPVIVDSVALLHGEALDFVYKTIDSIYNGVILADTSLSLDGFLQSKLYSFYDTKGFDVRIADTSNIFPLPASFFLASKPSMSTDSKNILKNLDSVLIDLANGTIDSSTFISNLDTLRSSAFALTDDAEKLVIGISVEVTRNSFLYWQVHYDEWDDLIGEDAPKLNVIQISSNQREVLEADGNGALVGGLYGAIGGIETGPGALVTGALGAMFGGAIASSKKAFEVKGSPVPWWLPF
jgi:hypothetical protein